MNRQYPYVKLKDVCDVNQGLQIPINERYTEPAPNRYFYITVQFLKASHINKFYVDNPPKSSICNEEDILIVRTGSTGQIVTGVNGCFHNNFFKVNYNKKLINGRFLYHCLNTKEKYNEMLKRAGVTTIPDLNHFMFLDMEIPFPTLDIQMNIGKTLDFLESKIKLNNQINAELESMSKTLYDYWFVQFDFPDENGKPYKTSGGKMVWSEELNREIPEGWKVRKLGDIGNFKNGVNYDPSNPGEIACPIINVRNISASTYFIKNEDLDIIYLRKSDVKKYAVHNGSIIIARSGIPGATRLIADIAENTLYCGFAIHYQLENLDFKIPIFFYLKSNEYQIQNNGSGGTIMKNVNQLTLNALNVCLPVDNSLLLGFNNLIQPIFDKISLIQIENQKLTELRDWLLPMLMNGQVTVD